MTALSHAPQSSAIFWLVNGEPYRAVFNDPTDPDYVGGFGGDDDGVTGLDAPELRENAGDITEGHGGYHGNFFAGRRPVTISVAVTPTVASTTDARNDVLNRIARASNLYTQDGVLIWFPGDPNIVATTRVNLIPDPGFEYDIVGNEAGIIQTGEVPYGMLPTRPWDDTSDIQWTSQSYNIDSAHAFTGKIGNNSVRLRGTKDNNATSRSLIYRTDFIPVVGGRAYSARAKLDLVDGPLTGAGTRLQVQWYDANQTIISTVDSNVVAAGTSGTQTVTITNTVAPTNAAYCSVRLLSQSTTALDVLDIYMDAVLLAAETAAGAYLDGDSANSSWLGLEGFSQSVNRPNGRFIAVRRQQFRQAGIGMTKQVLIGLVAADPRIYSTVMQRATVAHATDLTIENQGDWEAPVIWRVYGPYSAGTVTITATAYAAARTLQWTRATGEGAALNVAQVDEFQRSMNLNPTVYPPSANSTYGGFVWANTSWPGLMPGPTNKVRFDASGGGTTGATIMDVRWRDTWM